MDATPCRPVAGPDSDPLTIRLCKALGVARASQIVTMLYAPDCTRARIASLAPEVLAACDESPEDAARLLPPAGAALAETVAAVARALGWPGGPLPLAAAGSFLLSATAVRQAMIDELAGRGYQPALTAVPEPARGAVILAGRTRAAEDSVSCIPGVRHEQGRSQEAVLCIRRLELRHVNWSHPGDLGSSPADPRPSLSVSNLESSGLPSKILGPLRSRTAWKLLSRGHRAFGEAGNRGINGRRRSTGPGRPPGLGLWRSSARERPASACSGRSRGLVVTWPRRRCCKSSSCSRARR